jgi:predicted Zn-dependent protease
VEETKSVAVVARDRHGHKHTVFKKVLVPVTEPIVAMHKVTKRVVMMVKDRHGRLHKVFRTETIEVADVHAHGRNSQSGVHPQNEDDVTKLRKTAHGDLEPKSDGTEPERLNPSYGKAYALYDEGANARISGDYPLAISNLGRALAMVPANSHGGPSVLQLNMEYDLAQAAEAQGDMALAARYYARALSDRPNFTEAAVRLATVLAKAGNYGDALRAARSAVQRSPNDPRTHAVLSVLLERAGSPDEAKTEKQKSKALMANIKLLDTAPLVSPEVAPPARQGEDAETTPAPNDKGEKRVEMKGDMKDDMTDDSTK